MNEAYGLPNRAPIDTDQSASWHKGTESLSQEAAPSGFFRLALAIQDVRQFCTCPCASPETFIMVQLESKSLSAPLPVAPDRKGKAPPWSAPLSSYFSMLGGVPLLAVEPDRAERAMEREKRGVR
jgi:hypothetical protein